MKTLVLVTALILSPFTASADHHEKGDNACNPLREACKGAGFTLGDHKNGKGLKLDCMDKLTSGQAVAGVTVDPAQVEQCKTFLSTKGGPKMKGPKGAMKGPKGAKGPADIAPKATTPVPVPPSEPSTPPQAK